MASSTPRTEGRPLRAAPLISLAVLVAIWAAGAWAAADPALFPPPWQVAWLVWREAVSGVLLREIGATLLRVAAAFVLAMSIGMALGLVMGRLRAVNRWLDPWLIAFLNLPALVAIVLSYLWIGLNETAAILAVAVNKIPLVTAMMREGARALDPGLDAMAQVFRVSWHDRLVHVVAPQLAPHAAAAARAGIALIWKIVLVVEFLGRSNGVGFQIHLHFQLFEVDMVLAWSVSFILVMLGVEKLILQPLERRARRWRDA